MHTRTAPAARKTAPAPKTSRKQARYESAKAAQQAAFTRAAAKRTEGR